METSQQLGLLSTSCAPGMMLPNALHELVFMTKPRGLAEGGAALTRACTR